MQTYTIFHGATFNLFDLPPPQGPTASVNDDFVDVTFGLRCIDPNGAEVCNDRHTFRLTLQILFLVIH